MSAFSIPLAAGAAAAAAQPQLRIPLPVRIGATALGGSTNASARQLQALRAVAAATARSDLAQTLAVAKEARDDPGAAAAKVDANLVTPVLQAVVQVQEDRSRAGTADEQVTAVARAAGADPLLAAAALSAIEKSANKADTAKSCLYWVATVDLALLERAAGGARAQLVEIIPDARSELKRIETRLDDLAKRLKAVEEKVGL